MMNRNKMILNLSVCSDPKIVPLFKNIMEDLEKKFQNYLPISLRHIELYNDIVNNLDQLKEKIINFIGADLILIFGPASMQNDITTTICEIADTESRSKQLFAKISDYLRRPNIQFSNYAIRNKKLIFLTTGSKSKILNDVRLAADAMVLGTYLLCPTARTNKHNIHGLPVIVEENGREEDTKKKTQEEDEILDIPQSKSRSLLKVNLSELSHLPVNRNVSDKTYRKTHLSESSSFAISPSVTNALSLIKQTVTKDHIVPVKSKFVNIESAFSRISSQGKVSVKDALTIIEETVTKDHVIKMDSELVDIEKAFRRISSEDKVSCKDVPQFRVATKRGYAVVAEKKANEIEVNTDESSESSPITLGMTKFVEKGDHIFLATAVIPEKNVTSYADESGRLIHSTSYRIKYGQNVMFSGSDVEKDQIIINDSTHIFSREVMLLTGSGCKNIKVFTKLSIGVMAIRNKSKYEQHLYDCNRLILISLLEENNFDFNSLDLGIIDDPENIIENITTALEHVDLLVTTGCFNDKDYVKKILKNHFKAVFHFESVDMKPGKSTAFASCYFKDKAKIILCLPGNPASVFVTAHLFFLPLVKYIHYIFDEDWPIIKVEVDQTLLLHSRPRYVWANLSWNEVYFFPKVTCNKECSINNDVSNSNGNVLLMLPPKTFERSTLEVSSRVQALLVKFPFSIKHTENTEHLHND